MSPAVCEDNVADVAGVLLISVAAAHDDAGVLSWRGTVVRLLRQRTVGEVILERTGREGLQQSKVGEIMKIFDVIDQFEALQSLVTEQALKSNVKCYQSSHQTLYHQH